MDPLRELVEVVALYGVVGLLAVGLAERFVPALPSYGVLVAIGIAASEGAWSVHIAVLATMVGSLTGATVVYLLARSLATERSMSILYMTCRCMRLSRDRVDRTLASMRTREQVLIVALQLVPTVRLISPLAAGLLQTSLSRFVGGTAAGIALWNGLFVSAGFVVSLAAPSINSSALALKVLAVLVVAEAVIALAWRLKGKGNLPRQILVGGSRR